MRQITRRLPWNPRRLLSGYCRSHDLQIAGTPRRDSGKASTGQHRLNIGLIIGYDSNAHHTKWTSSTTNRGESLLNFKRLKRPQKMPPEVLAK